MRLDPETVLRPARGSGSESCVICQSLVARGEPSLALEVTIGSTFVKALQKTVRKEAHLACAKKVHETLGRKISEAEKS